MFVLQTGLLLLLARFYWIHLFRILISKYVMLQKANVERKDHIKYLII